MQIEVLGNGRVEISFLNHILPYLMVIIITFKSKRVDGRKESWSLIPAVPLTSGVAKKASLHLPDLLLLTGQVGIQTLIA